MFNPEKNFNPAKLSSDNYNQAQCTYCCHCHEPFKKDKYWDFNFEELIFLGMCEAPFPKIGNDGDCLLAGVFECPHCFEFYWFHLFTPKEREKEIQFFRQNLSHK